MFIDRSIAQAVAENTRGPAGELLTAVQSILMDVAESPETRLSRVGALIARQAWAGIPIPYDFEAGGLDLTPKGGLTAWRKKRVQSYIEANLHSPLGVAQLAEQCGMSISHFSRAFRMSFGYSPHAYLLQRRIGLAQRLMLDPRQNLGTIALDCGMADQAHMTRIFKRLVGLTPAVWRRLQPEFQASS